MSGKLQAGLSNSGYKREEYNEDPSSKELNAYVQNLLKQMQDRFEDMSGNIVGRIDEMRKRIDDIEKSVSDLMNDLGVDDVDLHANARNVKI
ncbi:heat shock factor-binding protein (macronuclear) [Tetrahymena thermophila SB210]|uniref:Heat shock factor-binding protein n=1 Tax=Tetrahymena thermophila (strain SB210) TaxID=312017 RepID=Q22HF0_TETTS|nr:heat shock factor-binding protein [Tetrahymena thermophila SB210]EAR84751.2 heat shock factor-binding protein [Tetrahymena thermophila SB210]|eukprot:XP_001032414.2 heat shock factor-binding protein [Tetrahymena thermophila SB210]